MSRTSFFSPIIIVLCSILLILILVVNGFSFNGTHTANAASPKRHNVNSSSIHITKTNSLTTNQQTSTVQYDGGSVMQSKSITYAIFWKPSTLQDGTPTYISPSYESLLQRYFGDVGGSPLYNNNTQYYDQYSGHILNTSTFGGAWVDTLTPYTTPSDCSDTTTPNNCLTDLDIHLEIERAIKANKSKGWTGDLKTNDLKHVFFVFTSRGEGSCTDTSSTNCAFPSLLQPKGYCGYHGAFTTNSKQIIVYANIPYAGTSSSNCENIQASPNNDKDADNGINATSHEHMEAVTDPLDDGWYDPSDGQVGGEIGDKCVGQFGTLNSQHGDVIWRNHPYIVQKEWSNVKQANGSITGCTLGSQGQLLNGTIYVSEGATVNAYNTSDGTPRWSTGLSNVAGANTTPIAYQGKVFYVDSNGLHALNASSGSDSGITYSISGNTINSISPIIANNVIYISSYDSSGQNYMDAFSISCSPGTCTPSWTAQIDAAPTQPPTFANSTLYLPLQNEIEAFDVTVMPGTFKWKVLTSSIESHALTLTSGITVDNGVMFVAIAGNFSWNALYAIKPTYDSGTGAWTFPLAWQPYNTNGAIRDTPTINKGTVYFTSWGNSNDGSTNVDALNETTGTPVWNEVNIPSPSSDSTVSVAGTALYFGTHYGICSMVTTSGKHRWCVSLGNNDTLFYNPIVTNGVTFINEAVPYPYYVMNSYALNNTNGSTRFSFITNSSAAKYTYYLMSISLGMY